MKYFPTECILSLDKLKMLCEEWKKVLGLENWQIDVKIKRDYDMTEQGTGYCNWTIAIQSAFIEMLDHIDWYKVADGFPHDMEKTLVHELLHCRFAMLDSYEKGTADHIMLEQNIDLLANAMVGLKRETYVDRKGNGKG